MIYLDNAATSCPKPPSVIQAVVEAMNTFGGAGRGGHQAALAAGRCIFRTRSVLGELLGAAPEQVILTGNATESLNLAIGGLLRPGDHVITTPLEHNSVLRPLYRLQKDGLELSVIRADEKGSPVYEDFRTLLRPNTRAVVCTHASNLTGTMMNLWYVGQFCRRNNLLLIVDASQTAGAFPIDVGDIGIDALCFTGHKSLLGPQGTGGLVLREGLVLPPIKVGGSGVHSFDKNHPSALPEALEAGTHNAHGAAGLLAGVEFILERGVERIWEEETALADRFRAGVEAVPGVTVYGDPETVQAPIVALNVRDVDSGEVSDRLDHQYGICTRPGAHCAPLMHKALGTVKQGAVRFSFSPFNTGEEVEIAINAVREIAGVGS